MPAKLAAIKEAIKLFSSGSKQTVAEQSCGLYKGFLGLLRGGKIPYAKGFHVPTKQREYNTSGLLKKGQNNSMKNKGKGYTYSKALGRWMVYGYKENKRVVVGTCLHEEQAIEKRKQYLLSCT